MGLVTNLTSIPKLSTVVVSDLKAYASSEVLVELMPHVKYLWNITY